jgi:ribonucleoside-diphosphate reductase alpha chain
VNLTEGPVVVDVPDYGYQTFGVRGKRARDVTIAEHLSVLLSAQKHVDSAISKTCNVPADTAWEDFKDVYLKAWEGGAKGVTTYQMGCKRGAVLQETSAPPKEGQSCTFDPQSGRKSCE